MNNDNKLLTDIVIVDEISMCDLSLFYALLSAIDFTKTKLLIIGDSSQIPSVGAGNILFDIIFSILHKFYLKKKSFIILFKFLHDKLLYRDSYTI